MTSGPTSNSTPPRLIDNRYKVLSVLGDGGFGKTFLVADTRMPSDKQCVLKQLKPVHERPEISQMVRDRFEREAVILEKLGEAHDQIPRLYAHFEEDGEFYLVEEWIEGITLAQKVQREGPQSEAFVRQVIEDLLPVVGFVHSQRMVHRDIKPDNVVLRSHDQKPVLIDFGAVKESMKTIISSGTNSPTSIAIGTPGYMPMEQMAGRPVYASDIYSLGMTAIYLLTGKNPPELETDPQTGLLAWRPHAPRVSDQLAFVLDRATNTTPQGRFAKVEEIHAALSGQGAAHTPSVGSANTRQTTTPQTSLSNAPSTFVAQNTVRQETRVAARPQPFETNTSAPKGSFKSTLIVGSLAGLGILIGGFWIQNKFFNLSSGESSLASNQDNKELVTVSSEDSSSSSATTASKESDVPIQANRTSTSESQLGEDAGVLGEDFDRELLADLPGDVVPNANAIVIGTSRSYRVMEKPGASFIKGSVETGSHVRVLQYSKDEDNDSYPWYQVLVPSGAQGWVPAHIIQVVDDSGYVQIPPENVVPNSNAAVIGTSRSHRVMEKPGASFIKGSVEQEARIRVLNYEKDEEGYPWYQVLVPSGAWGWIPEQVVQLDEGATLSLPEPPSSIPRD